MTGFDADIERLEAAFMQLIRAFKRPQRWAHVTARAGVQLDRPAAAILQLLVMNLPQRLGVQDVADQLGIEAPSVTRKTQELEAAGYLRRSRQPNDRRAVELRLTPRGRQSTRKLWKSQRLIFVHSLRGWPAADRQQFITLFERFSQDLAHDAEIINHKS